MSEPRRPKSHLYRFSLARYRFIGILFSLILCWVLITVFRTMFVEGEKWREAAKRYRTPHQEQIIPVRGEILSAQGEVLAISIPSYTLYFDFKADAFTQLQTQHPDSLQQLLRGLAQLLTSSYGHVDSRITQSKLRQRWQQGMNKNSRHCLVMPHHLSYAEYKQLRSHYPFTVTKLVNGKEKQLLSPLARAIYTEGRSVRTLPFGELASRTVGSVYGEMEGGISQGKNGIELYCDSLLRGSPGKAIVRRVGGRNARNTIYPAERGATVYTTLDMNLQRIVDEALRDKLAEANALRGSAAVMEVGTGKVVAISNLQRVGNGRYAETQNYIVNDLMEPGSTFKTPILMAALEDGIVTTEDPIYTANGTYRVGSRIIRDHNAHRGGYGTITVGEAFRYSSNIGMVQIVQKGYDRNPTPLLNHLDLYGFTTDLKLEIPGYGIGRIYSPEDTTHYWTNATLHSMSYGYELQIPPIYILNFYNAIASGGKLMKPYFIEKIVNSKGEKLFEAKPQVLNDSICTPHTLSIIKGLLADVVQKGTGKPALSPVVQISGKTGTSVISKGASGYNAGGRQYTASFVGYFPSEAPQYTCIVVVVDPKGSTGGGYVSGKVVKRIAEQIYIADHPIILDTIPPLSPRERFANAPITGGLNSQIGQMIKQHKVPWNGAKTNKQETWKLAWEENSYRRTVVAPMSLQRMPNLVGLDPATALFELSKRGLTVTLIGYGAVSAQSIAAGEAIAPGTSVQLFLAHSSGFYQQ